MPSFHNLIFDLPPVGEVRNGLEPFWREKQGLLIILLILAY